MMGGAAGVKLELYYGYVVSMAVKQYRTLAVSLRARVELVDLVQDGYVGLLEAARRFDPKRGWTFLTFAHYRIVGEMRHEKERLVRLPAHLNDLAPTADPRDEAENDMAAQVADSAEGPDESANRERLLADLREAVDSLNDEERELLRLRFTEGQTLRELSDAQKRPMATLYSRLRAILGKMRGALEAKGWSVEDLPEQSESVWYAHSMPARERSATHDPED
jgi:RNA polymerase sigma factor (sigma-70 family)